ncbi:MAG: transposase [Crocosphaera sp.]|nr:transposase [Crocosphaera sp.]
MPYKKQPSTLEIKGGIYFITFNTYERLELNNEARKVVLDACLYFHEKRYYLYIFVIMSDHVHLLIKPYPKSTDEYWSIGRILHSIKGYSSKQIPKVMKHIGKVWQDGRYDILIKNRQQFLNTWEYIRQNPVKEKYVDTPENYPFLWEVF